MQKPPVGPRPSYWHDSRPASLRHCSACSSTLTSFASTAGFAQRVHGAEVSTAAVAMDATVAQASSEEEEEAFARS